MKQLDILLPECIVSCTEGSYHNEALPFSSCLNTNHHVGEDPTEKIPNTQSRLLKNGLWLKERAHGHPALP